jgi:hypothetical protein
VSRLTLYLDEHVQLALAEALRARGVDILTTQEAKNIGLDDAGQLAFAAENGAPRAKPVVPNKHPRRGEHPVPEDQFAHG